MRYLGDPREQAIRPESGITLEENNRYESHYHWGAMVLDLCDMPIEEYMKNPFCECAGKQSGSTAQTTSNNKVFVEAVDCALQSPIFGGIGNGMQCVKCELQKSSASPLFGFLTMLVTDAQSQPQEIVVTFPISADERNIIVSVADSGYTIEEIQLFTLGKTEVPEDSSEIVEDNKYKYMASGGSYNTVGEPCYYGVWPYSDKAHIGNVSGLTSLTLLAGETGEMLFTLRGCSSTTIWQQYDDGLITERQMNEMFANDYIVLVPELNDGKFKIYDSAGSDRTSGFIKNTSIVRDGYVAYVQSDLDQSNIWNESTFDRDIQIKYTLKIN